MSKNMEDLVIKTRNYVREYMNHYDSSHDFHHVERVLALAEQIAAAELTFNPGIKFDNTTLTLATLLHDVGDSKYLRPGEDGTRLALDFLRANGASSDVAERIQAIVNHVSFSAELKNPSVVAAAVEKYPELAVLQDADRLDAMGAVGIGRCFTYNATRKTSDSMDAALFHFDDKLLPRADWMKTQAGKQLAVERTQRLLLFKRWWLEETKSIRCLS